MFQSDLDDSLPRLLELGSPLADVERAGGVEVDVPGPGHGHGQRCLTRHRLYIFSLGSGYHCFSFLMINSQRKPKLHISLMINHTKLKDNAMYEKASSNMAARSAW